MDSARTHPAKHQARELYARKADTYVRFVSVFGHQAGIEKLLARSGLLRDGMRILDAGCGTGLSTLALVNALRSQGLSWQTIDAFDFTPAMLTRFRAALDTLGIRGVTLREADVRELDLLPDAWTRYDLIISVSMLEYVRTTELAPALAGLRARLSAGGTMVILLTKKNAMTWGLIEKWWKAHRYSRKELRAAFHDAGFGSVEFRRYPFPFFWLSWSNHVVFARA